MAEMVRRTSRSHVALVLAILVGACGGGSAETAEDSTTVPDVETSSSQAPDVGDGSSSPGLPDDCKKTLSPAPSDPPCFTEDGIEIPWHILDTDGVVLPPVMTRDEAEAAFGEVGGPWSGDLTSERLCDELPAEHLLAMFAWYREGAQFEESFGFCQLDFANTGTVGQFGMGELIYGDSEYAAEQVKVSAGSDAQPIEIRDEAYFDEERMTLYVRDGFQRWRFDGPDDALTDAAQFLDAAGLVLDAFSWADRTDVDISAPATVYEDRDAAFQQLLDRVDSEPPEAPDTTDAPNADFTIDELIDQSPVQLGLPYGDAAQSACFMRSLLDGVGVDRLAEIGVRLGDDPLSVNLSAELGESEYATVVLAAFASCDLGGEFSIWQAVQGSGGDPDRLQCAIDGLDEATIAEIVENIVVDQQLFEPGSDDEERLGGQIFDEDVECITGG